MLSNPTGQDFRTRPKEVTLGYVSQIYGYEVSLILTLLSPPSVPLCKGGGAISLGLGHFTHKAEGP
jgi:hypothetical protein